MDAEKRAAFALEARRHIQDRTATRETARRTLIEPGIYTEDGKMSPDHGGVAKDDGAERASR